MIHCQIFLFIVVVNRFCDNCCWYSYCLNMEGGFDRWVRKDVFVLVRNLYLFLNSLTVCITLNLCLSKALRISFFYTELNWSWVYFFFFMYLLPSGRGWSWFSPISHPLLPLARFVFFLSLALVVLTRFYTGELDELLDTSLCHPPYIRHAHFW